VNNIKELGANQCAKAGATATELVKRCSALAVDMNERHVRGQYKLPEEEECTRVNSGKRKIVLSTESEADRRLLEIG
jgi:hypothetical protein